MGLSSLCAAASVSGAAVRRSRLWKRSRVSELAPRTQLDYQREEPMDHILGHIRFCMHNLEVIDRRSVKATAWRHEKAFWDQQIEADLERLHTR